jgi:hypothetical protein
VTTTPFLTESWRAAAVEAGRYADASVTIHSAGRDLLVPALRRKRAAGTVVPALSSMPLGWGFGGIVADGPVDGTDVRTVAAELVRSGTSTLQFRPSPHQDVAFAESGVPWTRVTRNHSYEVALTHDWHAVFGAFSSSTRRATRKAEKAGVRVERRTDAAAVAEFYRLYRLSVSRWALQSRLPGWLWQARAGYAEPLRKYHAVVSHMADDCGIWLAHHGGRVVAAIIVLSHGTEHAYWRGAMDADLAGPVRANDLLQARAIEHACSQGATRYAMGLTGPGSGLARFKSGFGAQPRVSHEYLLDTPWRSRLREAGHSVRSRALATATRGGG